MSESTQESPAKPIDWESFKMLAMTVGLREAARRMGISEDAVRKRSSREGWFTSDESKRALELAREHRSHATAVVTKASPAALLQQELAALSGKSRVSLARGVAKAAEHIEQMQGADIVDQSQDVKNIASAASTLHGWDNQSPIPKIRLELVGNTQAMPVYDVEAEVISGDTWPTLYDKVEDDVIKE